MSIKNDFMESIIETCGEPQWSATNAPAQQGMNPIQRCGYRFRLPQCLGIKIPEHAKVEGPFTTEGGTFMKVSVYGIEINVYDEIPISEYIYGNVEVMLKTWEPIEAVDAPVPDGAVKNYAWYLKVMTANDEQPEGEVILFNAKRDLERWKLERVRAENERRRPVNVTGRTAADMCSDGHFAHDNHAGRNQHFKIVLNAYSASQVEVERKPRRPKAEQQAA